MPATRAHVFQHVRVVLVHTGRLERRHGGVLNGLTGSREVILRIGPRIFRRENKQNMNMS